MGACDLNHIEQKANGYPILLEVYRNGHVRFMVRRRPGVGSETQSSIMFLVSLLDHVNFQRKR